MKKFDRFLLCLAIFSLIGLGLRIFHLDHYSLWLDEAITVRITEQNFLQILKGSWHTNPPLYFLMLKAWIYAFGQSEFALRSLSTILGTGAIVLTGLLAVSLFDRKTGILAALFMTIMVFPVHYSREARNYALFLFTATGSFYYLHQSLRTGANGKWLAYLLFSTFMCYSHNYWVFCSLGQNVYVFLFYRRQKQTLLRWLIVQAILAVLVSPWLIVLLGKTRRIMEEGFWIQRPNSNYLLKTFRSYVDFLVSPQIVWAYLAIFLLGLLEPLLTRRPQNGYDEQTTNLHPHALLALWISCSILSPFLLSFFMTPIYVIRFTIAALPAFYILLARGIVSVPDTRVRGAAILSVLIVSSFSLYHYYLYEPGVSPVERHYLIFPQHRWREFLSNLNADDVLFIEPNYYRTLPIYYGKEKQSYSLTKIQDQDDVYVPSKFRPFLKGKHRLWIIFCRRPTNKQLSLMKTLDRRFQRITTDPGIHPTGGRDIYVFDLRKKKSSASSSMKK